MGTLSFGKQNATWSSLQKYISYANSLFLGDQTIKFRRARRWFKTGKIMLVPLQQLKILTFSWITFTESNNSMNNSWYLFTRMNIALIKGSFQHIKLEAAFGCYFECLGKDWFFIWYILLISRLTNKFN